MRLGDSREGSSPGVRERRQTPASIFGRELGRCSMGWKSRVRGGSPTVSTLQPCPRAGAGVVGTHPGTTGLPPLAPPASFGKVPSTAAKLYSEVSVSLGLPSCPFYRLRLLDWP